MFSLTKTFTKESFQVTPIMMDGEPIFLPQELGEQLGYSDLAHSIRTSSGAKEGIDYIVIEGEKLRQLKDIFGKLGDTASVKISPNVNSLIILTESGIWWTTFNSTKPECIALRIWVTHEVLPSIRKTGSYTIPQTEPLKGHTSPGALHVVYHDMIELVKLINQEANLTLDSNLVLIKADKATQRLCGYSPLMLTETTLETVTQDLYVTATELGANLTPIRSAVSVNKLLKAHGFQEDTRDHNGRLIWKLTSAGGEYGRYYDTGKNHSNGVPVQQIKWGLSVIKKIT